MRRSATAIVAAFLLFSQCAVADAQTAPSMTATAGAYDGALNFRYRPAVWDGARTDFKQQTVEISDCTLRTVDEKVSAAGTVPITTFRAALPLADVNVRVITGPDASSPSDADTKAGVIAAQSLIADDFASAPPLITPVYEVEIFTRNGAQSVKHVIERVSPAEAALSATPAAVNTAAGAPALSTPVPQLVLAPSDLAATTREESIDGSADFLYAGNSDSLEAFLKWFAGAARECGAPPPVPAPHAAPAHTSAVAVAVATASVPRVSSQAVSVGADIPDRTYKLMVHNKADTAITELYLSRPQGDWTRVPFTTKLSPGYGRPLSIPGPVLGGQCKARVKAVFADSEVLIKRDINVCSTAASVLFP